MNVLNKMIEDQNLRISTMQGPLTAVVQIGNSDDKLTQAQWHAFVSRTHGLIEAAALDVHFSGYSAPAAPWQNACWVFETTPATLAFLRDGLRSLAGNYNQDSVALTLGETEFVAAPDA